MRNQFVARLVSVGIGLTVSACGDSGTLLPIGSGGTGGGTGGEGGVPTDGGAGGAGGNMPLCRAGTLKTCYGGPIGTVGVGLCRYGLSICAEDGSTWSACSGDVTPELETCLTRGDDDCDGQTNEDGRDCACVPGTKRDCYSGPPDTEGVSTCHGGEQTCNSLGTGFGPCDGEVTPLAETCANDSDDDCDGQINEEGADCVCVPGSFVACYSGPIGTADVGICHSGLQVCDDLGTAYTACTGEVTPATESCSAPQDENCDGAVNENCVCTPGSTAYCYSGPLETLGVGPCAVGVQVCDVSGTGYGACGGEVLPTQESCNTNIDDDCDGLVNEDGIACVCSPNASEACYSGASAQVGVGVCHAGVRTCDTAGLAFGDCIGEVLPSTESCLTGTDDDCDGLVNEDGAGCLCVPGSTIACYAGAEAMWGVGQCIGGIQACDGAGTGYGPCVGAVGPSIEQCDTLADENCDGSPSCNGSPLYAVSFGDPSTQIPFGTAIDSWGNAYVTGYFQGTVTFGANTLTSAGYADMFLLKLSPVGETLWARRFGGQSGDLGYSVAVDSQDNVVLTGYTLGSVDFGGGELASAGASDIVVAKLTSEGAFVWAKRFGDNQEEVAYDVAIDASDNVFLTGYVFGSLDFGLGKVKGLGAKNVFVAKLDADGEPMWARLYGGGADQSGRSIAVDAEGNVALTGSMKGKMSFGNTSLQAYGKSKVFIALLDEAGDSIWALATGSSGAAHGAAVSIDLEGNVIATGDFEGGVNFGGGLLWQGAGADVFVAKFNQAGQHVFSKGFGDQYVQLAHGLSTDSLGNIYLTGEFAGGINVGSGALVSAGSSDVFIAKFAPNGGPLWSHGYGGVSMELGQDIAADAWGNSVTVGSLDSSMTVGATTLTSAGLRDIFVVKLGP